MNEALMWLMTTGGGGVVGYFANTAQARYVRKQQRRADDVALMKSLHQKLVELRDHREAEPGDVREIAARLESEAALLRHAKLRERVTLDLQRVRDLWMLPLGGTPPRDTQRVWTQDALDAIAAIARGDRLPEPDREYVNQLFFLEREMDRLNPHLERLIEAASSSPGSAELLAERAAWDARRRASRGWRRYIPRPTRDSTREVEPPA
ncbi:hypothetical protein ACFU6R_03170 [Streptomyces sp. NPDC057499]|uniref:hypothetical protein n=1 Tax=Streptomyces sp. NPDC057499 TaxID=3346150 RepID=UPI00369BDEF9